MQILTPIVAERVKRIVQILTPNCDQIKLEQLEQGLIVTERVKRILELEQGLIMTTRQAKSNRTSEQEQNGLRESCKF